MQAHEVLHQAFEKVQVKNVASAIGISPSLVYKWAEADDTESGSVAQNPLERVARLFEATEDEQIVQWLCHRAGGCFVRNPRSTCQKGFEVMPATQEIVQQFADLLGSISQAAADNAISTAEAKSIRKVWDELKRYTEGFVKCCEEGDFANLREWARQEKPGRAA